MIEERICANGKDLPPGILTVEEWNGIHDALTLALDALGDGPHHVDHAFLINNIMHQPVAIQIAHRRLQRL